MAKADSYREFDAQDLSNEKLLDMYTKMLKIRWYDRTCMDRALTVPNFRATGCHWSPGQEGVSVGIMSCLNKDDWMAGNHRSHGHALAKGADLWKMAAEITTKAAGTNSGFGGTMHIMTQEVGMLGEDGVVGPGAGYAAGAAYAIRARGTKQVVVAFGGDAHMVTPYFNMACHNAARFKLPFIYVIEANGYQINTPFEISTHLKSATAITKAYEFPGVTVDGQSCLNVYSVMKTAVERARAGEGPTLIEAKTYRYYAHNGVAGAKAGRLGAFDLPYRSNKELLFWLNKDPIEIHKNTLVSWGVVTKDRAEEINLQVKKEVEDAFDWADTQPVPKAEDATKYAFAKVEPYVLPRQLGNCPLY